MPTTTLPKLIAAGLALSETEGGVVESAAEDAEVVELPLALVTPVHPDRTPADNRSVAEITKARTRGVGDACGRAKEATRA